MKKSSPSFIGMFYSFLRIKKVFLADFSYITDLSIRILYQYDSGSGNLSACGKQNELPQCPEQGIQDGPSVVVATDQRPGKLQPMATRQFIWKKNLTWIYKMKRMKLVA